jgi:hypothetical protein
MFMAPVKAPETHLRLIAWFTDGATGAEVEALVRTYKRLIAVSGGQKIEPIDVFRQFATLHSGRISSDNRNLIFGPTPQLMEALNDEARGGFSVNELAEIFGRDRTTISRNLKRRDQQEKGPDE